MYDDSLASHPKTLSLIKFWQDAKLLSSLLEAAKEKLSKDTELAKLVPYRIQKRGCNDQARLDKIWDLQEPDPETMMVLTDNHDKWLQDPSSFWGQSTPLVTDPDDIQRPVVADVP